MNLNSLILFLNSKGCSYYIGYIGNGDMKFIYDNKVILHTNYQYYTIGFLINHKLLNLPIIILNLLSSKSNIQHKLALNLISQLNPNSIYNDYW